MSEKTFTIKYSVHCLIENFFGKETIVKNCLSEMHAKIKLNDYCKKKYGIEFRCIKITACTEKPSADNVMDHFSDLFGGNFGDALKNKSTKNDDYMKNFMDMIKNKKK